MGALRSTTRAIIKCIVVKLHDLKKSKHKARELSKLAVSPSH